MIKKLVRSEREESKDEEMKSCQLVVGPTTGPILLCMVAIIYVAHKVSNRRHYPELPQAFL